MTLLTNVLTFNFERAVSWTNDQQVPQLMEVVVVPLANPSFPDQATFVGGLQTQTVLLTNSTNSVEFNLVPTYAAGLSEPVFYRAEWRQGGITGRTYTQDFSMPAQNVSWDQLDLLGDYVDGTNYVQQSQVGVALGVAALNAEGQVVDADNTPVAEQSDITAVNAAIAVEVTNRTNAINALNNTFSTSLAEDINGLATTVANNLSSAVATVNATAVSNFDTLNNAIVAEASTRSSANTTFTSEISSLTSSVSTISTSLSHKADLETSGAYTGFLKESQIPPYLLLNAYQVSNQAGMLALSNSVANGSLPPIHYSDIAIWENGAVWMLIGDPDSPVLYPDPSQIGNWLNLTAVYAVNGLQGNVTLTPQIIGAVGTAGSFGTVTQAQVTGLASTLATYTPLTSFNTLNTTVSGILANTNIVYLDTAGPSAGFVNHAKLDASVAYVNNLNEVTLKDGTVIAAGTSSVLSVNGDTGPNVVLTAADVGAIATGGTIPESGVDNLVSDLAARVLSSDSRLTNARTPTGHHVSHELGGTDVVTLDPSQVTGLNASLAALTPLTTSSSQADQINSLQSSVTFLLGGGSPTSSPIKATWFDGPSTFTGVTNPAAFQTTYNVLQKSPFGLSIADGTYYYNPAGASANEWVYPYITPNGHLQLHKWNEANGPDPVYATTTALATLQTQVNGCATTTSLNTLQTQVNGIASQLAGFATTAALASYATVAQFNALSIQVGNCATQSSLNATNATVATLATQSSVNTLSTAIGGLASQTSLNAVQAEVNSNTSALAIKADLISGTVPLNELPSIPMSQVLNLNSTLTGYCPLDGGSHVPLANLPSIPESQITNLVTNLGNKADLVGGVVPSSQLPSLAITDVFTQPNRAGMLGLSGATVGDICVITGTSDEGTYILSATPPATFSNWVLLPNPQNITSVNGQTGAVVLTAASVNAIPASASIPISQITGLASQLASLATTSALTTAVSGLQSLNQVQGTLTSSSMIKQAVNYVAASPIPSLAGQQSIDGVLTPIGSTVLATNQPDSRNNGLWVVQSGAWIRTTDFASGSYFVRGTLVFVQNGQALDDTIWQETTNSGVVDVNVNNWANIMTAGGPVLYTNGNGISLNGTTNAFSLNVVSGGGLAVTSSGATIDTSVVARKFSGAVPAGSTVAPITHNLGTTDIGAVYVKEVSSGNQVLVCPTVTGPNTLTLSFASPPTTNQWRVTILA